MFNGTQAAISAGYNARSAAEIAYENLRKPHIRQAVDERMAELSKRAMMQADEVLERLTRIARSSISEVVKLEKGAVVVEDSEKWPDGFGDCVQEISQGKDTLIRVKLDSRLPALELLGKYHKLWTEKQEIGGMDGKPIQFALPTMEDSEPANLPEEGTP
jgi:phage terminase small subunit